MIGRLRLSAVLAAAMLVAACATPMVAEREAARDDLRTRVAALEGWTVNGRAAIQSDGESASLSLRWREERPDHYVLDLSGPFGAGAIRISGGSDHAVLEDGRGEAVVAARPEALLEAHTGRHLPVSALRYWMVGLPAPQLSLESEALDARGRPERLLQDGWEVRYYAWDEVEGVHLPRRVDLQKGAQRVRVAFSGWEIRR